MSHHRRGQHQASFEVAVTFRPPGALDSRPRSAHGTAAAAARSAWCRPRSHPRTGADARAAVDACHHRVDVRWHFGGGEARFIRRGMDAVDRTGIDTGPVAATRLGDDVGHLVRSGRNGLAPLLGDLRNGYQMLTLRLAAEPCGGAVVLPDRQMTLASGFIKPVSWHSIRTSENMSDNHFPRGRGLEEDVLAHRTRDVELLPERARRNQDRRASKHHHRDVQRQHESLAARQVGHPLVQVLVCRREMCRASSATWILITRSMIGCSVLPSRRTAFWVVVDGLPRWRARRRRTGMEASPAAIGISAETRPGRRGIPRTSTRCG